MKENFEGMESCSISGRGAVEEKCNGRNMIALRNPFHSYPSVSDHGKVKERSTDTPSPCICHRKGIYPRGYVISHKGSDRRVKARMFTVGRIVDRSRGDA